MTARQAWVAEMLATHERVAAKWGAWSRFDWEFLEIAFLGEVGEVTNVIKKIRRGDVDQDALVAHLREEIGDVAVMLALVFRAWCTPVPEPGRCDASVLAGRSGSVVRKFAKASALLVLAIDDALASKVPEAGCVSVPGTAALVMGTLELLAQVYDTTVDECVEAVLPKIRARFPAPSDVVAA